jgi:hypothetical protein
MDRDADLTQALAFVVRRIEEEARRSGEPLTDEQRFLLHDLPRESVFPPDSGSAPEFPPPMMRPPKDLAYERLIALAKEARRNDLQLTPTSELDWKFADAVSKLNDHPMSWLLRWAGVKERKPWWDRPLLVGTALTFASVTFALMWFAEVGSGSRSGWIAFGVGYIGILLLFYFASRHIEEWQLKHTIEKHRSNGGPSGQQS